MSFSDVLDATLNGRPAPPVPSVTAPVSRVITPPLVAFVQVGLAPKIAEPPIAHRTAPQPSAIPIAAETPNPTPEPAASPLHASVPSPRKARVVRAEAVVALSPAAQRALAALNDLGAGLDSSMSLSDLRGAFRRLARCFHPDRHPGATAAERHRVSRCFAEATAHYRILRAAIGRRSPASAG